MSLELCITLPFSQNRSTTLARFLPYIEGSCSIEMQLSFFTYSIFVKKNVALPKYYFRFFHIDSFLTQLFEEYVFSQLHVEEGCSSVLIFIEKLHNNWHGFMHFIIVFTYSWASARISKLMKCMIFFIYLSSLLNMSFFVAVVLYDINFCYYPVFCILGDLENISFSKHAYFPSANYSF